MHKTRVKKIITSLAYNAYSVITSLKCPPFSIVRMLRYVNTSPHLLSYGADQLSRYTNQRAAARVHIERGTKKKLIIRHTANIFSKSIYSAHARLFLNFQYIDVIVNVASSLKSLLGECSVEYSNNVRPRFLAITYIHTLLTEGKELKHCIFNDRYASNVGACARLTRDSSTPLIYNTVDL